MGIDITLALPFGERCIGAITKVNVRGLLVIGLLDVHAGRLMMTTRCLTGVHLHDLLALHRRRRLDDNRLLLLLQMLILHLHSDDVQLVLRYLNLNKESR